MHHPAPARPWLPLIPLAGCLALAACSTPQGPAAWRIEPVYSAGSASQAAVARGYAALAKVYESEGRWQAALDAWHKATAADPADADLHTSAGVALARAGQLEQAIEQFRQAAALQPGSARALNNLGYALALGGHDAQAATVLGQALAADPTHASARANLASVEMRLAQHQGPLPAPGAGPNDEPAPATVAELAPPPTVPPLAAPPAAAIEATPADDVPDKVMAMLLGKVPAATAAPLRVQTAPSVARLSVDSSVTMAAQETVSAAEPTLQPAPAPVAAAAPAPASSREPAPATARWDARVSIVNGVGVTGAAARVRGLLQDDGLATARLQNLRPYNQATTVVQYRPGRAELAIRIANRIPAGAATQEVAGMDAASDLRVVLGHDRKPMLVACVARHDCAAPATRQAAKPVTVVAEASVR